MNTLLIVLLASYFAPTLVALFRSHRQTLPIGLLNLFLGWTIVGWVAALVWSATQPPQPIVIHQVAPTPDRKG